VSEIEDAPGDYRLTFSLANVGPGRELNTFFTDATVIDVPVEEPVEGVSPIEGGGGGTPDHSGGVGTILPEHNLTYIDVRILPRGGGGGGGKDSHGMN
jgi:hypothetical protein